MRITDPRWPAVRELARTLLRTEGLMIQGPSWLEPLIHQLNVHLGDVQPSRTRFSKFDPGEGNKIFLCLQEKKQTLAQCSEEEPPLEVVWLPMDAESGWAAISTVTNDLLNAGYPGCLGCGGPHTEGEWDEPSSRKNMDEEQKFTP